MRPGEMPRGSAAIGAQTPRPVQTQMRKFDCVIFDMDGTLTVPCLDFAAISAELGLPVGTPVLEAIEALDDARRTEAARRLLDHEMRGAAAAQPADGAVEVVCRTRAAGLATALLTRNARAAMQATLDRLGMRFDLTWAREDGPVKPSPDGLLTICRRLGVRPQRSACVGDWVYDVQAARAAGCVSVLLARGRQLDWAHQADHVIHRLDELAGILGI